MFLNIPNSGSPSWKASVANSAALPATGNSSGDARITLDTQKIYVWSGSAWVASAGGGSSNSFTIMQTPLGTSPTAVTSTDTLNFTSSDSSVTITGNSGTDTIDFSGAGGGKQVVIGTGQTLLGSTTSGGAFGNFTNPPTVSFTASASKQYRVYGNLAIGADTVGTQQIQVIASVGSPTVNVKQASRWFTPGVNYTTSIYVYTIFTLTANTTYTFTVQGQASGTFALRSDLNTNYLIAEQIS